MRPPLSISFHITGGLLILKLYEGECSYKEKPNCVSFKFRTHQEGGVLVNIQRLSLYL